MVFSVGTPEYGCSNATAVPRGTKLPTARALQLMALVAQTGEHVLPATTDGNTDLRAYAMTHDGGTAVVLFNLNQTAALPVTATVRGISTASLPAAQIG